MAKEGRRIFTPFIKINSKRIKNSNERAYTIKIIIIKTFCLSKDTVKKMKRQPTRVGENIYKSYISDKGLVTGPYKVFF